MALMTAQEYIESLRKLNTRVYMFGEKIENWVDHPMIRPSINCVAMTYELAQNPEYADLMTVTSNLTGKKVNRFTHLHQSTEDLMNKVKMQRLSYEIATEFARIIRDIPEVTECYNISGSYDYLLKIHAPDMKYYQEFLLNVLGTIESLGSMESTFVMDEVKQVYGIQV